jgi:hypothetical protein
MQEARHLTAGEYLCGVILKGPDPDHAFQQINFCVLANFH